MPTLRRKSIIVRHKSIIPLRRIITLLSCSMRGKGGGAQINISNLEKDHWNLFLCLLKHVCLYAF